MFSLKIQLLSFMKKDFTTYHLSLYMGFCAFQVVEKV